MEYKGDYAFDELLENGGVSDDGELITHIINNYPSAASLDMPG